MAQSSQLPIPFGAVMTAMATPFTSNLEVDYKRAAELAQRLIAQGNDGLILAGTTGESPTLSHDEKMKLFKVVKEAVGKNHAVLAGTGSFSTRDTIALTKEVEALGLDGVLIVCPYYSKPPQEGLFQHFKAIAEATSLPIMIYNIPGRTAVNMFPETMERLAKIKNIVGVKESGSAEQVAEAARRIGAGFTIWSGDDISTFPFLSLGAKGVVSVAGHLVATEIKKMIMLFSEGRTKEAEAIHQRLSPFFKALFITTSPILLKAAMKLSGFPIGGLRLPLVDANEREISILKESMAALNLLA